MQPLTSTERIDLVNVFLLLFSCIVAIFIPFQLFLFVYAVLGPLHYLTEISWLHDRSYFSKEKKDAVLLIIISILVALIMYKASLKEDEGTTSSLKEYKQLMIYMNRLIFVGLGSAFFIAFIAKPAIKWTGIFILFLLSPLSDDMTVFFVLLVPTLIHVVIFTFLFMLHGTIKSGSKIGYLNIGLYILCLVTIIFFTQNIHSNPIAQSGIANYGIMTTLNIFVLNTINGKQITGDIRKIIFESGPGFIAMRFIAFAYTYHYLNWFSKTEIIRWNKVPAKRLIFIAIFWVMSLMLYAISYPLGIKWLFLLSFLHVALEFPLNYISIGNIFTKIRSLFT